MDLIERYLQALKFALPTKQRDDIIKELRDSILSQAEEKEAEVGHPLTEDEQVSLLKKLGSPIHLASRYRKQQHMIGATMFPIYWKVLKASLGLAFLVLVGASVATAAAGKTLTESLGVLFRYPSVALMTFAWITLAFSALEFFGDRLQLKDTWDPRKLPPLVKESPRKSQFELITQLLIQTIFSVWWLVGLHYQYHIGPGDCVFKTWPDLANHLPTSGGDGGGRSVPYRILTCLAAVDEESVHLAAGHECTQSGRSLLPDQCS